VDRLPPPPDLFEKSLEGIPGLREAVYKAAYQDIANTFARRIQQLNSDQLTTEQRDHGMPQIIYLTVPIVVEEAPSIRRINRLAKDAHDAFMVNVEPEEIGLLKIKDLDFDVRPPFGHVHHSEGRDRPCNENEQNCMDQLFDGVHVPEDQE
jgi:hypothetical protein